MLLKIEWVNMKILKPSNAIERFRQLVETKILGQNIKFPLIDRLKDLKNLSSLLAFREFAFSKKEEQKVRQFLADFFAGEIIQIADATDESGNMVNVSKEAVTRSKLRIDTRKWLMEQFAPGLYGTKEKSVSKSFSSALRAKIYLPDNDRS
jgi:Bacteriophage Sf6, terminase small subunit-like